MRESDEVNSSDKRSKVTRKMTQIEKDRMYSTWCIVWITTVLGYLHETEPREKCLGHWASQTGTSPPPNPSWPPEYSCHTHYHGPNSLSPVKDNVMGQSHKKKTTSFTLQRCSLDWSITIQCKNVMK